MDDLNLTEEEIFQLKSEGLIPSDWQPGDSLLDDPGIDEPIPGDLTDEETPGPAEGELIGGEELPMELGLPGEGEDPYYYGEGVQRGALEDPEAPTPKVMGAVDLLNRYERASPAVHDPSITRFSDIALRWLPTDDKALEAAHEQAKKSADQLAQIRLAAEKAAQSYPWEQFASAMLTPGVSYATALGKALGDVGAERTRRQGVARKASADEAELLARQAQQAESNQMARIRSGADLARAAATMQRLESGYGSASKTSTWGKKMAELGIDINSPEGQLAARRMWVLEQAKSNPAAVATLLQNPTLDPFSPEFAEEVGKQSAAGAAKKEAEAARKLGRQERLDALNATNAELRAKETGLRITQLQKKIDEAGGTGKSMTPTAIKQIQEASSNLRRAYIATQLAEGKEVPGAGKGSKDATGLFKGILPEVILQRWDKSGNPTRAALADLGSIIIHERSGAAVTAAEFPRLAPFIPKVSDDPKVAAQKARRFYHEYRAYLAEELQFMHETGYRVPPSALKALNDPMATMNIGELTLPTRTGAVGESAPAAEVVRKTKDGRTAVFDANTKKFLRYQ